MLFSGDIKGISVKPQITVLPVPLPVFLGATIYR
jgi:hypothetical protein